MIFRTGDTVYFKGECGTVTFIHPIIPVMEVKIGREHKWVRTKKLSHKKGK